MDKSIGFGLYQSCGKRVRVGCVSGLRWSECGGGGWVRGMANGLEGWGVVMSRHNLHSFLPKPL